MVRRLEEFLKTNGIRYHTIDHPTAYTAQEVAASADIPGDILAKPVMVKVGGSMMMAVVPASHVIDFDRLKEVCGADSAELAGEEEYQGLFPDCRPGAIPPFGNLYDLKVIVDRSLAESEEIVFAGGTLNELVSIAGADYLRTVAPQTAAFTHKEHGERRQERPVRA